MPELLQGDPQELRLHLSPVGPEGILPGGPGRPSVVEAVRKFLPDQEDVDVRGFLPVVSPGPGAEEYGGQGLLPPVHLPGDPEGPLVGAAHASPWLKCRLSRIPWPW